jgi:prophage DNA circulation protein
MSWRDGVRSASFRGVPFKFKSHDTDGLARRTATHEYPGRDTAFNEDLGKQNAVFEIEAYVVGDDYHAQRDRLVQACGTMGPGTLVHPVFGTRRVSCIGCRVNESSAEGRMARFQLSFSESGNNQFPNQTVNHEVKLQEAVEASQVAAAADFERSFSIDGAPSFVSEDAVAGITEAVETVSTVPGQLANPEFAEMAEALKANASKLVSDPAALADGIGSLVHAASANLPSVTALDGVLDFDLGPITSPFATTTRQTQALNRSSFGNFVRRSGIIGLASNAGSLSLSNVAEAVDLRSKLGDLIDDQIDLASGTDLGEFAAPFRELKTAAVNVLNERAPQISSVINAAVTETQPALVLAHRLYGDASRAPEVAARNGLQNAGSVAGDSIMEAINSV